MPYADPERAKAHGRAYHAANRAAIAEKNRAYREAHREEMAAKAQAYYRANREQIKERVRVRAEGMREELRDYMRSYYAENKDLWEARHALKRDEILAGMRDRYQEKREAERERNRRYFAEHPERARVGASTRRARRRERFVENVSPLVVLERDDGVCGICGEDVDPTHFHVDHILPLSRGGEHSYANTQPAHPVCNQRKHDKFPEALS